MTQLKTPRLGRGGIETERRQALIGAVIGAVEQAGSIEVTMADIAARAGVSPALAHHYFGAKDDLLIAAMRQLLREFRAEVTRRLIASRTPRERVSAVIEAAFDESQFRREAISAWLVFYVAPRKRRACCASISGGWRPISSRAWSRWSARSPRSPSPLPPAP